MANPLTNSFRLLKAGLVLSFYGVQLAPKHTQLPFVLKLWKFITLPVRGLAFLFGGGLIGKTPSQRLVHALTKLGPTYIKLGQFLATRPDVVGAQVADDLSTLQDKLPPFSQKDAVKEIETQLGKPHEDVFETFSAPIAAASIAQVHKASVKTNEGTAQRAVKILRPHIEARFARDQAAYGFAARLAERFSPPTRRLRPTAVVKTLDRSMAMELDLRMEAAAMSEMAENMSEEAQFRIPQVDWDRSTQRILTTQWVDGTPISHLAALDKKGFDRPALANELFRIFLRQAMGYGFFHADMHPGNLFVDDEGRIVAVDFGIMGRLTIREQRYLAEILNGFLTKNYRRAAKAHFDAGYVPKHHSVDEFAQSLRAIGEPVAGKDATDMSMGRFLGQLFENTAVFDMQTRPELILLQKNLVIVEGVCRTLNPQFNMWDALSPVVKEWVRKHAGPARLINEGKQQAEAAAQFMAHLPDNLTKMQTIIDEFHSQLSERNVNQSSYPWQRTSLLLALWLIALSLLVLVLKQVY